MSHLVPRINDRVIDIENEAEIWAEEMDSDFEEFDEGYDGSILDLDVQTVDGKSTPPLFTKTYVQPTS